MPRHIEFRKDLPRNPTGKILKFQLRDEGCTASTWDREKVGFEMKKRVGDGKAAKSINV